MVMSIQYDYEKREIHIPVNVDSKLNFLTPPVAVPLGEWNLFWELDEESVKYVFFVLPGVEKRNPDDLPRVTLECQSQTLEPNCCPAKVKNGAKAPNGASLDLWFQSDENGKRFAHDPTIAVTLDPVGG